MIAYQFSEMVRVDSTPGSFYPVEFTWRGRRHRVRSIETYRTENKQSWQGVVIHRLFRLRTTSGMRYLLSQDVARNIWHVDEVHSGSGG